MLRGRSCSLGTSRAIFISSCCTPTFSSRVTKAQPIPSLQLGKPSKRINICTDNWRPSLPYSFSPRSSQLPLRHPSIFLHSFNTPHHFCSLPCPLGLLAVSQLARSRLCRPDLYLVSGIRYYRSSQQSLCHRPGAAFASVQPKQEDYGPP